MLTPEATNTTGKANTLSSIANTPGGTNWPACKLDGFKMSAYGYKQTSRGLS